MKLRDNRPKNPHPSPLPQAGEGTGLSETSRPVRRDAARRSGMLLVAALVCIAVAIMLAATLGKTTLLQHRQADLVSCEQQSLWLAESAVQRAIHHLHASPDYAGETWDVPADVLGSGAAGVVIIQVTKASEPTAPWQVHVESRYPAETTNRVMCERTLFVSPFTSP